MCVVEGKESIDPDTLQVVELQILDNKITHRTYIKNGKKGILDITGIASKEKVDVQFKKTDVYKLSVQQEPIEEPIEAPAEELIGGSK